ACETVREAAWFRGSSKANLSTAIYEVHSELVCHRADMKLLNVITVFVRLLLWKTIKNRH
ncbi:hypothetical protein MJI69_32135, partial [Salmonella enterica subsp. enterica serovar Anatum]|nr:hypothetical protein [Salmonella enterica subsp. enterica serovar Anatum]